MTFSKAFEAFADDLELSVVERYSLALYIARCHVAALVQEAREGWYGKGG